MFWGLIMEPQRRYTQTVKRSFHISMAALDEYTSDDKPTQVICQFDDRNYLLCTLTKGKAPQVVLDLNFEVGDEISFATNGKAHVHLTGYVLEEVNDGDEEDVDGVLIKDEPEMKKKRLKNDPLSSPPKKKSKTLELLEAVNSNDEDDSDDSDVNMSDLLEDDVDTTGIEEAEDEEDEDDDGEEEEDEDDDDEEVSEDEDSVEGEEGSEDDLSDDEESSMSEDESTEKSSKLLQNGVPNKNEKRLKENQVQSPIKEKPQPQKKDKTAKGDKTPGKGDKTPGKGDKTPGKGDKTPAKSDKVQVKGDKTPGKGKTEKVEKTPAKGDRSPTKSPKQTQDGSSPQKRTIEGGVIIEDIKIGNGQVAKPGKFVKVYYEGRFKNNNKMFDSATKGPGFEFRLGRQEVIKGWDVGLAGMKVGGKRRIVCPSGMAYGHKGSPPTIPPNATLVFDVELKNVK